MKIILDELSINTKGRGDIIDLTKEIEDIVRRSNIKSGIINVFSPGSTIGITSMEYEPGLRKDLNLLFDKIAPRETYYYHHETWGDDNGSSHILSSIFKPFYLLPVVDGKLVRGTWQQVVLVEFDTRPRNRKVVIQVIGE
ncbi:MAG: secondary thiamine-phosphate synthase enzyme YjbQ [Spirochaetia bacterium]|nr:secondary thiamine-phosphate synthase enzyme YjbQ [Spirochaetota bacterium]MCX8097377.1 secondary thiamine-phosphate synthase enzyme YjbQ [Spirochaetota bacterium]MDW8112278.1 secondary thiamine-phosphate synthase enzyme YjbQ [Spirochaetia bacterium]